MAESETDQQETTPEAKDAAAANHEKWVDKFEKVFRLMDSSAEGEAAAAFRQAKAILPKIGMTFGNLLEMLNNGQSDDLQQLVEQYKTANAELKLAEDVLLQENSRLNFLLRNFRDAKMESAGLDVKEFKNDLGKVVGASKEVAEQLKELQLPAAAEDMEELYKKRIAEGLSLRAGHEGDGLLERILLWSLSAVAKRDFSDDAVFRLQDLVQAQEKKIKELSGLSEHVTALREQAQDISSKLDLIVAESAPKTAYDEAMQHLKDLQILMGDGKDIKALKAQNEALQVENGLLHRQIAELANMTVMQPQSTGPAAAAQGQAAAAQGQPSQQQQKTAAFHVLKGMEEMMRLRDKEITDLRAQLAQDRAAHVLSADDLALVTSLAQALPSVDRAAKTLELASDRYAAAEAEKKESVFRKVFSFGKGKKDKKKADKSALDIREMANSARDVAALMDKLLTSFNEAAAAREKEMVDSVTAFEKSANDRLDRHFEDARRRFEESYLLVEETHTRKISGLQATADSLDAQIKRLETLKADRESFEQDYQDAVAKALAAIPAVAGQAVTDPTKEQAKIATSFVWKAYYADDTKHVDFCLNKGADINALNDKGFTMLICAVYNGNIPMTDLLLSRGADISIAGTNTKKSAFDYLAEGKMSDDVRKALGEKLLNALPDVKTAKPAAAVAAPSAESQKAANRYLLEAFRAWDQKRMELCLRKGANVDERENGFTLITCAVYNGNLPMVDFLLSQGADPCVKDTTHKKSAFEYLAEAKVSSEVRAAMTEKLLNALPDRTAALKNGAASAEQLQAVTNLMWQAFYAGNTENIALCLKKGADVNATDGNGYTMLMQALKQGSQQMAEFVLSQGPDVLIINKYDYDKPDAFGYLQKSSSFPPGAKAGFHQKLLQALPDRIKSPKNAAASPEQLQAINNLMWQAFSAGNRDDIALCLKKGADVNATDGNGYTMLMQAIRQANQQMAEFVLSECPDVLVINKYDYNKPDAFAYLERSFFSAEVKTALHQKLLQALPDNAKQAKKPSIKMAV